MQGAHVELRTTKYIGLRLRRVAPPAICRGNPWGGHGAGQAQPLQRHRRRVGNSLTACAPDVAWLIIPAGLEQGNSSLTLGLIEPEDS
jgi:hypothetical protein